MKAKNWALFLLSTAAALGLSVSTALAQVAEVIVDGLNVRSGPGTSHAIRGTLPQGTQAKIIENRGDWYYIVMGAVEGWVYGPFITVRDGQVGSSPEVTVLLCQGVTRQTARVYRKDGQLMLRMHDRQQVATWLDTTAQSEVNPAAATYSNVQGELTTRVMLNLNSPTRCSIQVGSQPLEPGTVTQRE